MKFKKSDLKNGDIVTYKDGRKSVVTNGETELDNLNSTGFIYLDSYNEDLTCEIENINIVKVERPTKYETIYEREEILDEAEKRYLRTVIRPFRDKVKKIKKEINLNGKYEYIEIILCKDDIASLPDFTPHTMYKNMKREKEYTLKELGL